VQVGDEAPPDTAELPVTVWGNSSAELAQQLDQSGLDVDSRASHGAEAGKQGRLVTELTDPFEGDR
jgi:hypothetical protein